MDENNNTEHEKYQAALVVATLSYDLNVANPTLATLLRDNTLDTLVAKRDELLQMVDEQVAMDGFWEVPDQVDAKWLATQLQTELGSYVDAGEYNGVKAIVPVAPGTV